MAETRDDKDTLPANEIVVAAKDAKQQRAAAEKTREPADKTNWPLSIGIGIGVGSAALAAALLYANRNRGKK